ncbi:MAG: DUF6165 family protein [Pseudomonadota bacterium]
MLRAPISWGELLDKISILEIKLERINDPGKRANVEKEHTALCAIRTHDKIDAQEIQAKIDELKAINEQLWDIEDAIRECEKAQDFQARFIRLARAVYQTNDHRAAIKKELNILLGSELHEEKSYAG